MLSFCGFNGFGQFGSTHNRRVSSPTDFHLSEFPVVEVISPAWSYNVFAAGNRFIISGLVNKEPNKLIQIETPDIISRLATCDRFCLVLLQDGKLFKFLPTSGLKEVKFAVIAEDSSMRKRSIFGDRRSDAVQSEEQVQHIACGSNIAVAITRTNSVYNIPCKIHQFPRHEKVVSVQCGFEHALVLTANGDLYTWGNGFRGQLGLDVMRIEEQPTLIDALGGIKVKNIAAGGWHSAAVSAFGDIYTWGFNVSGQLGLRVFKESQMNTRIKNPSVYPLPQLIDLPACCSVIESGDSSCSAINVFTGTRHTIVQMSCGSLLVAGWNAHGQLAQADLGEITDQFTKLSLRSSTEEVNVFCGPWCTIFQSKFVTAGS